MADGVSGRGRLLRSGRTPTSPTTLLSKCVTRKIVGAERLRRWESRAVRPRRWRLLPSGAGAMNRLTRLLHQEASPWKGRHGLNGAKQVCQGACRGGARSLEPSLVLGMPHWDGREGRCAKCLGFCRDDRDGLGTV